MRQELRDRLERARTESFDHRPDEDGSRHVFESGDDVYYTSPSDGACTCPDRSHRQIPCKHLLHLAIEHGAAQELLTTASDRRHSHIDRADHLREKAGDHEDLADVWADLVEYLDSEARASSDPTPSGDSAESGPDRARDLVSRIAASATGT